MSHDTKKNPTKQFGNVAPPINMAQFYKGWIHITIRNLILYMVINFFKPLCTDGTFKCHSGNM